MGDLYFFDFLPLIKAGAASRFSQPTPFHIKNLE
jgi:hypothetical protein